MPKYAANISMMFNELPFLDRIDAAAAAGFPAVEFLFPFDYKAEDIAARLKASNVTNVLFNMPPGDWAKGERGIASLPDRDDEFRRGVDTAIAYAQTLGTRHLHVMAGLVPPDASSGEYRSRYIANLNYAAARCAPYGITVLIEPINSRDMPGYLLSRQSDAHDIRKLVGAPNLKVQMDFYHAQIMEGDLATTFKEYRDHIGHVQIAGVPERHEPDTGEVNYAYLFGLLDELGYQGWVGCEYRPAKGTVEGLAWLNTIGQMRSD
ncbi:hydroxypyruvate isomerase family protein [Candidimonas sp. SYP-B2681]|uniref:2-oxo-tetronate isomerase n=1 Tax=Candidimonas sp. SYP-B2681 TaxID=2497686 RepID=UPI000F87F9AC|nr:2-oxo-tetronate isomerase [Candidimonas sp. SYP-B2681]RTZ47838.1 hydroxypyruvate isomerase family protein [Candidimonas sp. SYP-B2681]